MQSIENFFQDVPSRYSVVFNRYSSRYSVVIPNVIARLQAFPNRLLKNALKSWGCAKRYRLLEENFFWLE